MTGAPIVVKIGGSTLGSHDTTLKDLVTLQKQGVDVVVVHGGGNVISQWMQRQGIPPRFVDGLRVTDAASLEIVVAVLSGLINKELVSSLQQMGGRAIGISGVDGNLLEAHIANPELGFVGEVSQVNSEPLRALLDGRQMFFRVYRGRKPFSCSFASYDLVGCQCKPASLQAGRVDQ